MLLVKLKIIHYAPKDSEEGIKEFLVVQDQEQLLKYIDSRHLFHRLRDYADDNDTDCCCPETEWLKKNPGKLDEARQLGLKVEGDDYITVEGPTHLLIKWYQGDTWREVSEAYYGVTHYDWSEQQEIDNETTDTLLRVGVANDIRNWKEEE